MNQLKRTAIKQQMKPNKAITATVYSNKKRNMRRYKRTCYKQTVRSSWENKMFI